MNNFYGRVEDPDKYHVTLELKSKVLYENIPTAIQLMEEIILTSDFTDEKRLKEILAERKIKNAGADDLCRPQRGSRQGTFLWKCGRQS